MPNKKLQIVSSFVLALVVVVVPMIALAVGEFVTCDGPVGISGGTVCDLNKLLTMVNKVIDFFAFRLVPLIATGVILWAGIRVVSQPESVNAKSEVKKLLWTLVLGLVIIYSAYFIVQAIINSLVADNEVGQTLKETFN
ncbi:MAG: hypothetical protein WCW56_02290 [Candidatus Paceibacterota bacterium]|jgi:hypothetical protein